MSEPTILPSVLKITIGKNDISPKNQRTPANGITASLGTGATMLSKTIKKNTPAYPAVEMIFVKSPINDSNIESVRVGQEPLTCKQYKTFRSYFPERDLMGNGRGLMGKKFFYKFLSSYRIQKHYFLFFTLKIVFLRPTDS